MKRLKIVALATCLLAAFAVASSFTVLHHAKPAKAPLVTALFLYDGSSGNEFDPTHYSTTTTIQGSSSGTAALKTIEVTSPAEVYPVGSGAKTGKPRVDADATGSTIHTDLVNNQAGTDLWNGVANRIFVQ